MITGCDPRQLQFDFGLWTRKIIRDLIRREFGIKFSEVQVGRLLKKLGLSAQRPLYRAYQRDPVRVEEWKKAIYPKIRKLAADEGASIFFEDEAGLRTGHHAGTTWGPVGQTPVVVKTGERKSISMVSAISPRGELRFRVQEGRMNAARFIDFLKALLDSVPGKIFLIVDGHPVHRAKKAGQFVENEADGRLKMFFLPSYSPDLNPDEWVLRAARSRLIILVVSAGHMPGPAGRAGAAASCRRGMRAGPALSVLAWGGDTSPNR
jgi:transposase